MSEPGGGRYPAQVRPGGRVHLLPALSVIDQLLDELAPDAELEPQWVTIGCTEMPEVCDER